MAEDAITADPKHYRSVPTLVIEGYGTVTELSHGEWARILEID